MALEYAGRSRPEGRGLGAVDGLTRDETSRHLRAAFAEACREANTWPLPGQGETQCRFALLSSWTATDTVLGRLVEAHADALAIQSEMEDDEHPAPAATDQRWGVWAAGPPGSVEARHPSGSWRLRGTKRWCSGADLVSHALVDASSQDGQRLFAVDLSHPGVKCAPADWVNPGMIRADTRSVEFDDVPAEAIGRPGEYLSRPGFWAGAVGVAACWHGGSIAVARTLHAAADDSSDAHVLAHLGATYSMLLQNDSMLVQAARWIDEHPSGDCAPLARAVRFTIERNATAIIDRVGRALGAKPLAHDCRHAQAVNDLQVYIRQDHAERDLECLGRDLMKDAAWRPW